VDIPIITGGGIRTAHKAYENAKAGANWIVVGNAIENNPLLISEMSHAIQEGSSVKKA
jgi:heptaprenylglyceryl phosphate synthase